MALLYDQFGREIQTVKKPDRRPLGAAPRAYSSREYIAEGLTPLTLATVFREADAGDMRRQAELFTAICEKDGHILGEITKRREAITDVEYRVTPATDSARDLQVAEFVQALFDKTTEDDEDIVAMQAAVGNGYSCMEINWDVSAGQAVPRALSWIEPERLTFTDPEGLLRNYPRLITDDNLMGEEIPPWKVIFHAYGGKTGHPTRSGILRVCTWMYLFKNYAIKDWVTFCEIYGMPIRLGKYESGAAAEDRDALVTALASIGTDAAGVISKATEIEFVQAQGTATSAKLYKALCDFANKEMSKAIVGQTLSADVGDVGSYAAAQTHNEIRIDLAKADSRAIAVTRRSQLLAPIVGFNFGWDTPVPFYGPVWEEEEDLEKKATWLEKILDRVAVPVSWVRREFGIPEPEDDEETVGGPAAAPPPEPSAEPISPAKRVIAKAGKTEPPTNSFTDRLEKDTQKLTDGMTAQIRELVNNSNSLEEARDKLIELYGDMGADKLAKIMQTAFIASEMSGRYEVTP